MACAISGSAAADPHPHPAAGEHARASADAADLNAFLLRAKSAVDSRGSARVALVLGNEAADFDSMACAIAYAACADSERARRTISEGDDETGALVFAPVVGVPRDDFPLRGDAAAAFPELGVDVDRLIFSDEIDVGALADAGRLAGVVLVDHNALAGANVSDPRILASVGVVLDHHEDERAYPANALAEVAPVGSCATLVAEAARGKLKLGGGTIGDAHRELYPFRDGRDALEGRVVIASLLLSAILLDTQNLDASAARATDRDAAQLSALASIAGVRTPEAIAERYEALKRARFDQSRLGARDLLRRDYKQWRMGATEIGVASFGVPLRDLEARHAGAGDVRAACARFADERGVDALVLMSAFDDPRRGGAFRRELAMAARDGDARDATEAALRALASGALGEALGGLTPIAGGAGFGEGMAFEQGDPRGSRKKAQPAMLAFFRARETAGEDAPP